MKYYTPVCGLYEFMPLAAEPAGGLALYPKMPAEVMAFAIANCAKWQGLPAKVFVNLALVQSDYADAQYLTPDDDMYDLQTLQKLTAFDLVQALGVHGLSCTVGFDALADDDIFTFTISKTTDD